MPLCAGVIVQRNSSRTKWARFGRVVLIMRPRIPSMLQSFSRLSETSYPARCVLFGLAAPLFAGAFI